MTEAERAELLALADDVEAIAHHGTAFMGDDAKLIKAASALRRLANAQEQTPVAGSNASVDDYRNAIDEALVVRYLGVAKGNAKSELDQIISWEVDVNLDPAVSSRAQALIDQGRNASAEARLREALEHYADQYCEGWCEQDAGCANFDDCGGCLARRALSQHSPASDCDKSDGAIYAEISRRETPPEEQAALDAAVDKALKDPAVCKALERRPHASDCEKQVPSGYSEYTPIKVVGSTSEPRGCPTTVACSCPSDRTADVTVERHPIETLWREVGLPEYFLGNGGTNHKLYALYDAIRDSDAFTVGRR